METTLKSHMASCAAAFAAAKGVELVTVARLCAGDWRFFDRIGGDASFTARKYDSVMGWFEANWPAGLAWPSDVPKPSMSSPPEGAECTGGHPGVSPNPQTQIGECVG